MSHVLYQPKNWTQVSDIAGRFSTDWATREAQHASERQKIVTSQLKSPLKGRGIFLMQKNVGEKKKEIIHDGVHPNSF